MPQPEIPLQTENQTSNWFNGFDHALSGLGEHQFSEPPMCDVGLVEQKGRTYPEGYADAPTHAIATMTVRSAPGEKMYTVAKLLDAAKWERLSPTNGVSGDPAFIVDCIRTIQNRFLLDGRWKGFNGYKANGNVNNHTHFTVQALWPDHDLPRGNVYVTGKKYNVLMLVRTRGVTTAGEDTHTYTLKAHDVLFTERTRQSIADLTMLRVHTGENSPAYAKQKEDMHAKIKGDIDRPNLLEADNLCELMLQRILAPHQEVLFIGNYEGAIATYGSGSIVVSYMLELSQPVTEVDVRLAKFIQMFGKNSLSNILNFQDADAKYSVLVELENDKFEVSVTGQTMIVKWHIETIDGKVAVVTNVEHTAIADRVNWGERFRQLQREFRETVQQFERFKFENGVKPYFPTTTATMQSPTSTQPRQKSGQERHPTPQAHDNQQFSQEQQQQQQLLHSLHRPQHQTPQLHQSPQPLRRVLQQLHQPAQLVHDRNQTTATGWPDLPPSYELGKHQVNQVSAENKPVEKKPVEKTPVETKSDKKAKRENTNTEKPRLRQSAPSDPDAGGWSSSTSVSDAQSSPTPFSSPPPGSGHPRRQSSRDRRPDPPTSQSGWTSFVFIVLVLVVLPVLGAYLYNEHQARLEDRDQMVKDRDQMVVAFGKFQTDSLNKINTLQTSVDELRTRYAELHIINTELHTNLAELRSQYERSAHVTKSELETQNKKVALVARAIDNLQNLETKTAKDLQNVSQTVNDLTKLQRIVDLMQSDVVVLTSICERSASTSELEAQNKQVDKLAHDLENVKTKVTTHHTNMTKTVTILNSKCEKSATKTEMEAQHTQLTHAFDNLKKKATKDLKKISDRHTDFRTSFDTLTSKSVVAWYGPKDKIPQGWRVCDGKQHTPSLAGRMLTGAGEGYLVNSQGGHETTSVTFKLTEAQLPPHNHHADDGHKYILKADGSETSFCVRLRRMPDLLNLVSHKELSTIGQGEPITLSFDNRPPYHAVYFICRKN